MLALAFAVAVAAEAPLEDAAAERRAQTLMREIRCVVCENEPVSQSTADIARDMRRLIREQVASGASDGDIRTYFSDRYGDFVLFRPRSDGARALIWVFPLALLAAGGAVLVLRARSGGRRELSPVADDRTGGT